MDTEIFRFLWIIMGHEKKIAILFLCYFMIYDDFNTGYYWKISTEKSVK